jgi:hypothetical protein
VSARGERRRERERERAIRAPRRRPRRPWSATRCRRRLAWCACMLNLYRTQILCQNTSLDAALVHVSRDGRTRTTTTRHRATGPHVRRTAGHARRAIPVKFLHCSQRRFCIPSFDWSVSCSDVLTQGFKVLRMGPGPTGTSRYVDVLTRRGSVTFPPPGPFRFGGGSGSLRPSRDPYPGTNPTPMPTPRTTAGRGQQGRAGRGGRAAGARNTASVPRGKSQRK